MGLFILAGNAMYPVFLRLLVWAVWKATPETEAWRPHKEMLQSLMDHPRRYYNFLLPLKQTTWLAMAVFILNSINWTAFGVLNV